MKRESGESHFYSGAVPATVNRAISDNHVTVGHLADGKTSENAVSQETCRVITFIQSFRVKGDVFTANVVCSSIYSRLIVSLKPLKAMRTIFFIIITALAFACYAQDSLKTTSLSEVVVTGTKYELSEMLTGKTITKVSAADLEKNAGKMLGDVLNEIPGLQMDGNFGTPGSNVSYYLRGGRNKNTLVLIDGVPLNDPSAINAEYDLRYIPVSQIESIEVLKGSLSTLYGTGAAAGVINIILKKAGVKKFGGELDLNAGSYGTFGQNLQVNGTQKKIAYMFSANNVMSEGFSSAQDNDESVEFDKDGFSRQNVLAKVDLMATKNFSIGFHSAYERFDADFDAYEFTDADNTQTYDQVRIGVTPTRYLKKGQLQGKFFYNRNVREFEGEFPSLLLGKNLQAEIIHRHPFSESVQILSGLNYQYMAFNEKDAIDIDTTNFALVDPYSSILFTKAGFAVHAGIRLNNHSEYGSKLVYNINPSYVFSFSQTNNLKLYTAFSTAYITPSLYQMYSYYGNKELNPEESQNFEVGATLYLGSVSEFSGVWFTRKDEQPIDFVPLFDSEGMYIGGKYFNLPTERSVDGLEFTSTWNATDKIRVAANYTRLMIDQDVSFYKIPNEKYGATLIAQATKDLTLSLKYNYTSERDAFDFSTFEEVELHAYQLVDVFASYTLLNQKLSVYAAVNNLFDEEFVGVLGYTTRGRNYSGGVRYRL
jgi:vitamin B12 transporter